MKPPTCLPLILALLLLGAPTGLAAEPGEPTDSEDSAPITRIEKTEVRATRTDRTVETLTGRADVYGRDEIELTDAWTLDETIQQYPSVDVVGSARYGQEVRLNLRGVPSGFSTQRTLVLLDGRPLTDGWTGSTDLAQYSLLAHERVEIVRGPQSSAYGTNAMGGLVNFIPRRGGPVERTTLLGEYGSDNTGRLAFTHSTMFDSVDLFLGFEGTDTDGYRENAMGDDMDWRTRSGFLNLGWSDDRIDVLFMLSVTGAEGTDEFYERKDNRNQQDLIVTYDTARAHDAVTKLHFYRNDLDETLDWFFPIDPTRSDQLSYGGILTQSWRVATDHLLTGGFELRREDVDNREAAGHVDEDANLWSVFVQDDWQATEALGVVAGVRWDDTTTIDSGELSWRLGANWRACEKTTVRGAVGKAFRAPTLSDQYLPTTFFDGDFYEGNPDLGPETFYNAEVGVDHQVTPEVLLSLTGFASQGRDFWDYIEDTDGTFRPHNITRIRILGIEAEARIALPENLSLDLAYTFTDGRYEEDDANPDIEGNRLDDNVANKGSAILQWRHPQGHAARLGAFLSGNRYTDPENSGEGELDPYWVAFFQAEYAVTKWAKVTVDLQNIFNEDYAVTSAYPAPGRKLYVGLAFAF